MPHPALLFILLLLPNTTLRDWQRADAPHLHALLREGDAALMNARTAERDKITPLAACRSLGASARMNASPDETPLAYPVQPDTLGDSLRARGVATLCDDALACAVTGQQAPSGNAIPRVSATPALIVSDLGNDPAKADAKIGAWATLARTQFGVVMVISPNPSSAEYQGLEQLTPIVRRISMRRSGLLYSPSTRHPGLVTNTDVAPTIAAYFGTSLRGPTYGASIQPLPLRGESGPDLLERADDAWIAQARAMRGLPYLAGVLAAVIALLSYLAWRGRRGLETAVLLVTLVPFVLLLSSTWTFAASLLISALACAYLLRDRFRLGLAYLGSITAALVVGDAVMSSGQFTGASLLGYSPIEGARYYGVGNEAMGAVIGAGVVLTMGLLPRRDGRSWCILVWVVITAALAWPTAGAKAGGLLVGLIALATLLAASSGRSWRDARVWGGLLCALALGVVGLWLLGRYGARSHLTLATESAERHGSGVYGSLLLRKGLMDAHLVFHSVWIWVLLAAVVGGSVAARGRWTQLTRPERATVFVGYAAAAACLTLNDAGVVAAAICSLFVWAVCFAVGDADNRPVA